MLADVSPTLDPADLDELRLAKSLLESPSLAVRIANLVGAPIEKGFALLPARASGAVQSAVRRALEVALDAAVRTLGPERRARPSDGAHRLLAIASGGAGGFFGLPALAVELPISTTILLRSIADHARAQGEDLALPEARLACVEVFALGGRRPGDDAAEAGYFAVRAALARAVGEAATFVAERGLASEGAPALARLVAQVAARFSIPVGEKVAAQAIPLVGALGGAAINALFAEHFQDVARGHFTVRRLERAYGEERVRAAYAAV